MPVSAADVALVDRALALAGRCAASGDVPVGAVVVGPDGATWGDGYNRREADGDPCAHAEILALREAAAARGGWRLDGATLAVTLEPCPMCAGALVQARVARVVFGAWDDKAGACGSVWDLVRDRRALHRLEVVGGVREDECVAVLRDFFSARRAPGRG
ncbi:nucleoside deaminase [Agilicoccus flavus]|uniref:nucleoside deaminase n=1 Tax=Agilicoccus flavus TaxID=2775968 RepID=UPI001CF6BC20|nr:nucleoside deaminase [Agilicoccus flavus]